jgi:hypothetical protein
MNVRVESLEKTKTQTAGNEFRAASIVVRYGGSYYRPTGIDISVKYHVLDLLEH